MSTILINLFSYTLQYFTDSHDHTSSPEMLETSYASLEIPPEPGQPIAIDSSSNSVELAWNTTALVKKKEILWFSCSNMYFIPVEIFIQ